MERKLQFRKCKYRNIWKVYFWNQRRKKCFCDLFFIFLSSFLFFLPFYLFLIFLLLSLPLPSSFSFVSLSSTQYHSSFFLSPPLNIILLLFPLWTGKFYEFWKWRKSLFLFLRKKKEKEEIFKKIIVQKVNFLEFFIDVLQFNWPK